MSLNSLLAEIAAGATPWKLAVRCLSTTNIASLSGLPTVDSVVMAEGDRLALTGQTAAQDNGIYVVSAGAWSRAADMKNGTYCKLGTCFRVQEGTANGGDIWVLSAPSDGQIRIGVTQLTFAALFDAADLAALDAATSAATPSTLALRAPSTAACAFGPLTAPSLVAASGGLILGDTGQNGTLRGAEVRLDTSAAGKCSFMEGGVEHCNMLLSGTQTTVTAANSFYLSASSYITLSATGTAYVTGYAGLELNGNNNATGLQCASFVMKAGATGNAKLTFTTADAFTITGDPSLTSLTIGIAQDATAAGGFVELRGQRGAAGFAGGKAIVGGGLGGTGGTDAPGPVEIDLGRTYGGTSALCQFVTNTGGANTTRFSIGMISGGVNLWAPGSDVLDIYSGNGTQLRSSGAISCSCTSFVIAPSVSLLLQTIAGVTKCTTTIADAFVENFASGVSADRQVNASSRLFCDATGVRHGGRQRLTGIIRPASIGAGNTNDWNPTGFSTASVVYVDTSAAGAVLTGLVAGQDGDLVTLINASANDLDLSDDDAASTAANRFGFPADQVVPANGGVCSLIYDGTGQRWRHFGTR